MQNKLLEIVRNQFVIFAIFIAFFTILGFFGSHFFLFDVFSQFRLQYLVAGLIFFIIFLLFNSYIKTPKWIFILIFFLIIANAYFIFPWLNFNETEYLTEKNEIKVSLMNVLTSNDGYTSVLKNINKNEPDIIFLEEVNSEWLKHMSQLDKKYPYSIKHPREDNFGIAFYSKFPFKSTKIVFWGDFDIPVITSTIKTQHQEIQIIGMHTTPPTSQDYFINRNKMFSDLANFVKKEDIPTLIIGDLNTTMYSSSYKKLIKESKLINARKNFGLIPSWSPKFSGKNKIILDKFGEMAIIPIDHVLHNSKIEIKSFKTDKSIGSDHLPLSIVIKTKP